ncbi:MAG: ATP synthase F1 subunit delta [Anaerovoracaceae bacterium]
MAELNVDTIYGHALYLAAAELDKVHPILKEGKELLEVLDKEHDFLAFINTPVIPAEEKKEVIKKVFENKLSHEMINFLFVLVDKGRTRNLCGIIKAYEKEMNEKDGYARGKIFSVVPLSQEQIISFERETGKLLSRNVKLKNVLDEKLIGGIKILIDGKIIDASIRSRLESLSGMFI